MNRFSFDQVVDWIRKDSVFFNNSHVSQALVENQLKYALYRMSHDENESGFLSTVIM
jgi:hypothetical protein